MSSCEFYFILSCFYFVSLISKNSQTISYPIVYIIPMFGAKGANAVVGIQLGYCIADVISKCGVGFIIYNITAKKSALTDKDGYRAVQ